MNNRTSLIFLTIISLIFFNSIFFITMRNSEDLDYLRGAVNENTYRLADIERNLNEQGTQIQKVEDLSINILELWKVVDQREHSLIIGKATITGYSPQEGETDSTPFITASNKKVNWNELNELHYIAVSRDLMKKYNLEFGDQIFIGFQIEDLMNKRITNSVDIFFSNEESARNWGRQCRDIIIKKNK